MDFVPSFIGQSCGSNEIGNFIEIIEQMASQNKWDEVNTIIGSELKIEKPTNGWWTIYKEHHPSSKKWEMVKEEFLKQLQKKGSTKVKHILEMTEQEPDTDYLVFQSK